MSSDESAFLKSHPDDARTDELFGMECCTQNFTQYLKSIHDFKSQDQACYHWPSEVDPHVQEVTNWAKSNISQLFPKIVMQSGSDTDQPDKLNQKI